MTSTYTCYNCRKVSSNQPNEIAVSPVEIHFYCTVCLIAKQTGMSPAKFRAVKNLVRNEFCLMTWQKTSALIEAHREIDPEFINLEARDIANVLIDILDNLVYIHNLAIDELAAAGFKVNEINGKVTVRVL